jgi:hypothetical protein
LFIVATLSKGRLDKQEIKIIDKSLGIPMEIVQLIPNKGGNWETMSVQLRLEWKGT